MVLATNDGPRRRRLIPELDGVRGLAICGVIALHFVLEGGVTTTNALERGIAKLASYGVWGVDLFFVLSGFLITGILLDSKGSPGYLRNFYVRRTLRIFPLYYGVLLILFVLTPHSVMAALDPALVQMREAQRWVWPYLTNYYLSSQTTFSIPYIAHFWSLAVEEHFYLVWPFAILLLSRRSAMRLCLLLGLFALGLRTWYAATAPGFLASFLATPCRLDALCAGAWFALSQKRSEPAAFSPSARGVGWLTASAVAVLTVSFWHVIAPAHDAYSLSLRTSLLAAFFGLFISLAAQGRLSTLPFWRPCALTG